MSRDGVVQQRLREFVQDRVRKGFDRYERGAGSQLAKFLGKPTSWVSEYTDPDRPLGKRRTADLDTALAICRYFGVSLESFATTATPVPKIRPERVMRPAPTPSEIAIKRLTRRVAAFDPARVPELVQILLRTLKAWEDVLTTPRESVADLRASPSVSRAGGRRTKRER